MSMTKSIRLWYQRSGFGKGSLIMLIFVGGLLLYTLISAVFSTFLNQYTINEAPVTIYVGENETIQSVSGKLEAEEVMNGTRFLFYTDIYTDWDVYIKKVYEGEYVIPSKTHIKDVIRILKLDKY